MTARSTGYAFGVFDLFNIEHVDALRQGLQHCDRVVVGVATDELVVRSGGRQPFVPENERLEIVSALRWLDAVRPLDELDLRAEAAAVGADTVIVPAGRLDAVQLAAEAEGQLSRTGLRLVRLETTRRTASEAVRSALAAASGRDSAPAPTSAAPVVT